MESPKIDPYIFAKQFEAFQVYVKEKSGVTFESFASHPFTEEREGYKYEIYRYARDKLDFQSWNESSIGSGEIIEATIESIEFQKNNLVRWQSIYGDEKRPHQTLYEAREDLEKRKLVEKCLYKLYRGSGKTGKSEEAISFGELLEVFGKKYPLLGYLFFIKDSSKYLPIAPTSFDRAFEILGVDFKTSHKCSWENYSQYLRIVRQLKDMLAESISSEVTLLDAHSFAWILSSNMHGENKLANVKDYLSLSGTERDAIVKSRIGQGQFRDSLINYWSACAVTGCKDARLLTASHIKPWKDSEDAERLSLYNGFLLSPALNACFDAGFLSFDDSGNILISNELDENDMVALGIHREMQIPKLESEHKQFLAYHRENIFKK